MNWNKLSQDVATSKSLEIFKFQVTKTSNLMDQEFFLTRVFNGAQLAKIFIMLNVGSF